MAIDLAKLEQEGTLESAAEERGLSVEDFKVQAEFENRAEAEGKSVEELLEEEKEITGLKTKYGDDPKALAKALLNVNKGDTKKIEDALRSSRSLEDKVKVLEEQLGKISVKDQQDVMGFLKNKFPDADENMLKIMHEISSMQTQYAIGTVKQFYADDRLEGEKLQLKDDPYFKKYKTEIEERLEKLPVEFKLQRGVVKRVYDSVVGSHVSEILEENKGKGPKDDKEILGFIKGSKPAASSPGKPKSALTERQATHAQQMNLTEASYTAILKKRKETAKRNNKPEPELISDKVL